MIRGIISFQSNDMMDVFHSQQVLEDGIEASDEELINVEDPQFESDKAWVTGNVPKIKPVLIEGDTGIINGWFKGDVFDTPFVITIYVECEMAEELEAVQSDERVEKEPGDDLLEPMEIHL